MKTYYSTIAFNRKKRKHITQEEYDSYHNYNIESNTIERERE